jgi:hypothetical protein
MALPARWHRRGQEFHLNTNGEHRHGEFPNRQVLGSPMKLILRLILSITVLGLSGMAQVRAESTGGSVGKGGKSISGEEESGTSRRKRKPLLRERRERGARETGVGARNNCAVYASTAVSQQRENIRRGCGYTGSEWNTDYGLHQSWCSILASPEQRASGVALRARLLRQCKR